VNSRQATYLIKEFRAHLLSAERDSQAPVDPRVLGGVGPQGGGFEGDFLFEEQLPHVLTLPL
jgi:hypothetical protein